MLYMIEEYYKQHPERESIVRPLLDRFVDSEKYLHEMSLEELNAEVATWDALKKSTFKIRRGGLYLYFDWLKEQGVNIDPEIARKIVFPEKEMKFLIYSTDDIHNAWDDFILDIEKTAEKNHKPPCVEPLLITHVAGILGFYGMTKQQILSLQLSDVQPDGIIGYDLPLTERDMDVLLEYKKFDTLANRMKLKGTGYIRSPRTENPNERTIDAPLGKVECSEEMKPYMSVLTHKNLYKFGVLNKIFEYEKTHRPPVESGGMIPQWFKAMVNQYNDGEKVSDNTMTKRKQEYIGYRTERIAYQTVLSNRVKSVGVKPINNIINKIDTIINSISDENIIEQLNEIKQQVKGLTK